MIFELTRTESQWSAERGWEVVYTYVGPGSEYAAWVEQQVGYTSLRKSAEGDDWTTVSLTFAAQGDGGDPLPPTSPDYGLISRRWSKHTNYNQTPIHAHENVDVLWLADHTWPGRIQIGVTRWRRAYNTWLEAGGTGSAPELRLEARPANPQAHLIYVPPPPGVSPSVAALAGEYADLLQLNEDLSFEVGQPVLRKTELVTSDSVLKANHQYVDRVLSYPTLNNHEPTLRDARIIDAAGLQAFRWLKRSPEVEYPGGGKWEITVEYWGLKFFYEFIHDSLV
jgi:hypothetical protein